MRLEKIRVKNFRALQNVTIENLPSLCIFVGRNGSGKTTLFDIFGFLRACLKNNVRQALQVRGGFHEVVSRGHENEQIEIEIKFRLRISSANRLVTYILNIGLEAGRPTIKREILKYKRGKAGKPFHFLDFKNGKGYAITNEDDFGKQEEALKRDNQTLDSSDILAVKGVGQFTRFKAANAFRQLIENWHVSDFHIDQARGSKDAGYAEHLSTKGDNLSLVAQYIHENHPRVFQQILDAMKRRVPGIDSVESKATEDGRLVLKFQDGAFKDPFVDRYVSDGTIKMFAYLVLLYDPSPHPLLCVEEPENQLYPDLLDELAEEFRAYSQKGGQVMVSTHSPDFLNAAEMEEVFWLQKGNDGFTNIHRARDSELVSQLMASGDKMGWLWKQGLFREELSR